MKFIKTILTLGLLAVGLTVHAQNIGFSAFCAQGTAINAGTNYAIIPADSKTGGEPSVTYINVNSLSVNPCAVATYVSTNQTTAIATNTTTTNTVASTNGFYVGNWVVIQHLQSIPRFRNEACLVSALQNTNQIVFASAPTTAVAAGDIINAEIPSGSIPLTSSTTAREISNSGGVFTGQRLEPLLITAVATGGVGTNTLNVVNSGFLP